MATYERSKKSAIDATSKIHNGGSKIQAYKWKCIDEPGQMEMIKKTDLLIDTDYQRDANGSKVLNLASSWSWIACGVISVGERDGRYWVIDGQHRVLASMKRDDIEKLPCIIFQTEGQKQEAKGFLDANGNRKPVSAIAKFKAGIIAGDETAIYVNGVFKKYNISLVRNGSASPGEIKCVTLCHRMASVDRERFERVFGFSVLLCNNSMFIHERILAAIDYLDRFCGLGLHDKRLTSRMIEAGPWRLLEGAGRASAYFVRGGASVWANGFLDVINKGLSKRFEINK